MGWYASGRRCAGQVGGIVEAKTRSIDTRLNMVEGAAGVVASVVMEWSAGGEVVVLCLAGGPLIYSHLFQHLQRN